MCHRRAPVMLLSVLLLLQWTVAFGHCRILARMASAGLDRTCHAEAGSVADPSHHDHGGAAVLAELDCPACQLPAGLDASGARPLASARIGWTVAVVPRTLQAGPLGARAPPPPVRAPPFG